MDASKATRVLVPQRFERRRCASRGAPRPIRACAWRWRSSAWRATCNAKVDARVPLSFRVESCRRAFRDEFFRPFLKRPFLLKSLFVWAITLTTRAEPRENKRRFATRAFRVPEIAPALLPVPVFAFSATSASRSPIASRARDASEWSARTRGVRPKHRTPGGEGSRRARERRESRVASRRARGNVVRVGHPSSSGAPDVGRGGGRAVTRRTDVVEERTSATPSLSMSSSALKQAAKAAGTASSRLASGSRLWSSRRPRPCGCATCCADETNPT